MYTICNSFSLPCLHVVIDLQEQRDCLCRELDGACRHQQWLDNILLQDIRDLSLFTNIDIVFKAKDTRRERKQRRTFRTLMPALRSPSACRLRSSVTMAIGLSPAFSASVVGMTSSASAYAWKQYASMPVSACAYCDSMRDTWISGAPPPPISAL